jgi:hypothetical protein
MLWDKSSVKNPMGVEYLLALVFRDPYGEYVSGALGLDPRIPWFVMQIYGILIS